MDADEKSVLTVCSRGEEFTVKFVRGYGVTCDGLVTHTGSASKVAEALWVVRGDPMTYHDPSIFRSIRDFEYIRDLYNHLNIEFQRWNRP